jgi:hypothetical protein
MNPSFRTFVLEYEQYSYFFQRTTPLKQRNFYLSSILVPALIGLTVLVLFGWITGLLGTLIYVYHAMNVLLLSVTIVGILSALRQGEPHHRVDRRQEEWYWILWWTDRFAWIWLLIPLIGNIQGLYGWSGSVEFAVLTLYLSISWYIKRTLPDPRYLVGTALLATGLFLLLESFGILFQYGGTWIVLIAVIAWRRSYRWNYVAWRRFRIIKAITAIAVVLFVALSDTATYGFTTDAPNGLAWEQVPGISFKDYRILMATPDYIYAVEYTDPSSWTVFDTTGEEVIRHSLVEDHQYTVMRETEDGRFLYVALPDNTMQVVLVLADHSWVDQGNVPYDPDIFNNFPSTTHPAGRIVDQDQGVLVVFDEEEERLYLYKTGEDSPLCEVSGPLDSFTTGYGSSVYFHHFHRFEDGFLLSSTYQNEPYLMILDNNCRLRSDSGRMIPPPSWWETLRSDIRVYGGTDPIDAIYTPSGSEDPHVIVEGAVYRIEDWYLDNLQVGYPLRNRMEAGVLLVLLGLALPHPFSEPKKV